MNVHELFKLNAEIVTEVRREERARIRKHIEQLPPRVHPDEDDFRWQQGYDQACDDILAALEAS